MTLLAFGVDNPVFGNTPGLEVDGGGRLSLLGRGVPQVLARCGIPAIIAPNGTINASGQITFGTAILFNSYGPCWVYLPAGAISGGAAGLYYCVMSTNVVGQVYDSFIANPNTGDAGVFSLSVPQVLTPAVGTGAYTQTVGTALNLGMVRIPGNLVDDRCSLFIDAMFNFPNNANTKTPGIRVGTSTISTSAQTTTQSLRLLWNICGRVNKDYIYNYPSMAAGVGTTASAPIYTTVDTSKDWGLGFNGNIAVATDWLILDHWQIVAIPGAR